MKKLILIAFGITLGFSSTAFSGDCTYDEAVKMAQKRYKKMNFKRNDFDTEILTYSQQYGGTTADYIIGSAIAFFGGKDRRFSVIRENMLTSEYSDIPYEKKNPRVGTGVYYCFYNSTFLRGCSGSTVMCNEKPSIFSPNRESNEGTEGARPSVWW